MTCREFVEFLDRYVAGELTPSERMVFVEHIAICPDCANYLQTYEQTIQAAKSVYADESADVPADVPEHLVAAVLSARRA